MEKFNNILTLFSLSTILFISHANEPTCLMIYQSTDLNKRICILRKLMFLLIHTIPLVKVYETAEKDIYYSWAFYCLAISDLAFKRRQNIGMQPFWSHEKRIRNIEVLIRNIDRELFFTLNGIAHLEIWWSHVIYFLFKWKTFIPFKYYFF